MFLISTIIGKSATSDLKLIDLVNEKCSSSWLVTLLPIESHGFSLHKTALEHIISQMYRWQLSFLPTTRTFGQSYIVDHALICPIA